MHHILIMLNDTVITEEFCSFWTIELDKLAHEHGFVVDYNNDEAHIYNDSGYIPLIDLRKNFKSCYALINNAPLKNL